MAQDIPPGDVATWLALLDPSGSPLPMDPVPHQGLATARRALGDELGALAHLIAADTLTPRTGSLPVAAPLCDVATGYLMKGEQITAARWYQLALSIDPHIAVAYLNLASICATAGLHGAAKTCRDQAYGMQRVFCEGPETARYRVLILYVGASAGNVPAEILLPTATCCRLKYALDYAAEEEDAQLPPYDIVFNAIGEAEAALPLTERLQGFARGCKRPLLNPPDVILRTQRQRMAALLAGIDGLEIAPTLRLQSPPQSAATLAAALAAAGVDFPLLARPAARHGGEGLVRCDHPAALAEQLQNVSFPHYLTAYRDYRSADGYYRKYRIVFIDREPWPYHLAISAHWMVHYHSADMEAAAWKIAEERRFLDDAAGVLGPAAMTAIAAIGRRLDLDYAGIDFSLLPDGRVLVFEANATMLVHPLRRTGPLAHKNLQVQRIVAAFQGLLERRMQRSSGAD